MVELISGNGKETSCYYISKLGGLVKAKVAEEKSTIYTISGNMLMCSPGDYLILTPNGPLPIDKELFEFLFPVKIGESLNLSSPEEFRVVCKHKAETIFRTKISNDRLEDVLEKISEMYPINLEILVGNQRFDFHK